MGHLATRFADNILLSEAHGPRRAHTQRHVADRHSDLEDVEESDSEMDDGANGGIEGEARDGEGNDDEDADEETGADAVAAEEEEEEKDDDDDNNNNDIENEDLENDERVLDRAGYAPY